MFCLVKERVAHWLASSRSSKEYTKSCKDKETAKVARIVAGNNKKLSVLKGLALFVGLLWGTVGGLTKENAAAWLVDESLLRLGASVHEVSQVSKLVNPFLEGKCTGVEAHRNSVCHTVLKSLSKKHAGSMQTVNVTMKAIQSIAESCRSLDWVELFGIVIFALFCRQAYHALIELVFWLGPFLFFDLAWLPREI